MIYELLERMNAVGRENAISRKALASLTGLSDRGVRKQIENERRQSMPILSSTQSGGYYLLDSKVALREYLAEQESRMASIRQSYLPMKRFYEEM